MRAWLDGKWRPVQAPREITRGRNAGRIEVQINKLCRDEAGQWKPMPRPVILYREQIRGYEATL